MKTALLHYWLLHMRGGEKVLAELCRIFPDARLYTHACRRSGLDEAIAGMDIRETFIARLPFGRSRCQYYLPLMPAALKRLDLSEYELILSSESGPAKGVRKAPGALHICYCHTPMRYLWDLYDDYYRHSSWPGKAAMRLFRDSLRRYDLASADGVDHFIANSAFVAGRIRKVYGREATVIHPPVEIERFAGMAEGGRDYYLYAGQLTRYKRPDLAVAACRRLGRKLVVTGTGEMRRELERLAGGDRNVTFAGRVDDGELARLYAGARALLFPGVEDFGIVPLEAQAAGTPVVALAAGGALETVKSGVTGLLYEDSLEAAIEEFESMTFDRGAVREHAAAFGPERFRRQIADFIAEKTASR